MSKHPSRIIFSFLIIAGFCSTGIAGEDKGLQNYRNRQFEKARGYYESILTKGENPSASFGLGTSAFQQGDVETAVQAFDDVLEGQNNKLKAKSYYNMGNILHQQQRMDESLAFFKKSLELDPRDNDAKANYELIKYLMQQQEQQQDQQNQDDQQDQDKNDEQQKDQQQQESGQEKKEENSKQFDDQKKEQKQDQQNEKKEEQSDPKEQESKESEKPEEKTSQPLSESEEKDKEKEENKKNAEVILNALKQDDKINQKRKISKAASKKLEKDW